MYAAILTTNLVLLAVYVGFAMHWADNSSEWWNSLAKPSWQPPDYVFGLIWPYNFLMLGAAAFVIAGIESRTVQVLWTGLFATTVAGATWWGYEFYRANVFERSAVALTLTAIVTLPMMYIMWEVSGTMFWLLVPYQIWLGAAASLAIGYWRLNQTH